MAAREWVETASSWREIRIFKVALKRRQATAVLLSFSLVQFDFVRGFNEHNGNFSRSPRPSSCCML